MPWQSKQYLLPPHVNRPAEAGSETLCRAAGRWGGAFLGITGSGKPKFLNLIQQKLDSGKAAITLVPEIALTPQMVARYRSRFGDQVAVLLQSTGRRAAETNGSGAHRRSTVVLGPRSALFAPIDDLGLIIIDEEHEPSYKQEAPPRYHARECAIKRAEFAGAQVVLGERNSQPRRASTRLKEAIFSLSP